MIHLPIHQAGFGVRWDRLKNTQGVDHIPTFCNPNHVQWMFAFDVEDRTYVFRCCNDCKNAADQHISTSGILFVSKTQDHATFRLLFDKVIRTVLLVILGSCSNSYAGLRMDIKRAIMENAIVTINAAVLMTLLIGFSLAILTKLVVAYVASSFVIYHIWTRLRLNELDATASFLTDGPIGWMRWTSIMLNVFSSLCLVYSDLAF